MTQWQWWSFVTSGLAIIILFSVLAACIKVGSTACYTNCMWLHGCEYYVVGKAPFPGSPQTGNGAIVGSYQTLHRPQGGVCLRTHLTAAVRVCWCIVWSPWSTLMQCLGAQKMIVNNWYIYWWMAVAYQEMVWPLKSKFFTSKSSDTASITISASDTAPDSRVFTITLPCTAWVQCAVRRNLGTRVAHSPSVVALPPVVPGAGAPAGVQRWWSAPSVGWLGPGRTHALCNPAGPALLEEEKVVHWNTTHSWPPSSQILHQKRWSEH